MRTRIPQFFYCAAFILAQIVVFGWFKSALLWPILMVEGLMSCWTISAIILLVYSFRKADYDLNGKLCYSPHTIYWKLMAKLFNDEDEFLVWENEKKYCQRLHLTVVSLLVLWVICVLVWILVQGVFVAISNITVHNVMMAAMLILLTIAVLFICLGLVYLLEKKYLAERTVKIIGIIALSSCLAFIFIVVPIILIAGAQQLTILSAILVYLPHALGVVIAALPVVLTVYLFCKNRKLLFDELDKTFLGKLYHYSCPQIESCPHIAE